jgi:hypothetical protein
VKNFSFRGFIRRSTGDPPGPTVPPVRGALSLREDVVRPQRTTKGEGKEELIKKVGAVALAGSIALTALPLAHSRKKSRGSSQPRGPYSALRIASALSGAGRAGMAQAASVRFTAVSIGRDALPAGKPLTPLDTSQQPRKNDTGRGEEGKSVERDHPWGNSCGQEHDLERLGADL